MGIGLGRGAAPSRRLWSGRPRSGRWFRAVGAWVLLLGLIFCEAEESEPTEEDTPPLKEPTQEPPETTDPTDATQEDGDDTESGQSDAEVLDVSEFSSQPQESAGFPDMLTVFPEDGDQLLLEEVRVGEHEGYDRIVFEHAGDGAPGWQAEYVDEALEPGSGFPVEVEGEAILYLSTVGLVPENADSEQGQLEVTEWTDQQGTIFEDVVTTFVHHGAAYYYVGLDAERNFRVSVWEHQDGPRLIIDILH